MVMMRETGAIDSDVKVDGSVQIPITIYFFIGGTNTTENNTSFKDRRLIGIFVLKVNDTFIEFGMFDPQRTTDQYSNLLEVLVFQKKF